MKTSCSKRLNNIYKKLRFEKVGALLVTSNCNIEYLTGYPSRDSMLLASAKANCYFTDSRYTQEAAAALKGIAKIIDIKGRLFPGIKEYCNQLQIKSVGFEKNYTTYGQYESLVNEFQNEIRLKAVAGLIENERIIKTETEISLIRDALAITGNALKSITKELKAGKTELEISGIIEQFIRFHGAESSSFNIIVASGSNASYPHHITSSSKIKANQPLLIDLGSRYKGYNCDLTRVFFLGKITPLVRKVYKIVLEAQELAIKKVRPGISIKEIDQAARQHIANNGYGGFFGHSLGHGVGLEVHEAPNITANNKIRLQPGMVFTIEPGIYLPGKFGIRIEDMVVVTKKGCEVLSGSIDK
ncbi:MAG: aminopeptidase P family protein [Candidatus Omnitrophota bacterium]|jgi:Xaa-Pro aminopeptidase|nr:MAG: aminopeptidase P family protein [Candidatus Omnitrophota bacterium]